MTNEDAISREAVIRLVEQYPNIIGNRCSGLIADIKHLPPITPSYNSIKSELKPCGDCVSRESVGNMLNNIKMRGSEFWIDYYRKALDGLSQLPSVTPTISDVENNYNIGYNCGYADAMSDIADMRGDADETDN